MRLIMLPNCRSFFDRKLEVWKVWINGWDGRFVFIWEALPDRLMLNCHIPNRWCKKLPSRHIKTFKILYFEYQLVSDTIFIYLVKFLKAHLKIQKLWICSMDHFKSTDVFTEESKSVRARGFRFPHLTCVRCILDKELWCYKALRVRVKLRF